MMKKCQKNNLQEPQRNRNATANFINLIMTSTVYVLENAGGKRVQNVISVPGQQIRS